MKRRICIIWALTVGLTVKAQTEIGTKAELKAFEESVNNGTFGNESVTLTADIEFTNDEYWTPIGTSEHPFRGNFYGEGHKISNLNVNIDGLYAGLFGYVAAGAEVKEVHIMSGNIAVATDPGINASYHGGIAGYNLGSINKCSNRATVSGSNYVHARVGGIVGENGTTGEYTCGVIRNCYNLGDVYSSLTEVYIGGIAGYNMGDIKNCFMRSDVIKGDPTNQSSHTPYPLYGSNSGTVTNCFYANGSTNDVSLPIALADDSDNSTTLSGDNLDSDKNVLLSGRTLFTDGYWNTLCLPFNITNATAYYSPIAGATVKTLKSSSFSAGVLTLDFENATSIEAGVPYIVKWDTPIADNLSNPVFMNVTVSNSTSNIGTTNVSFVGSFSPVTLEADDKTKLYLGTSNTLYYPSKEKIIKSCRAYFELIDITAGDKVNEARAFVLNFGNGETSGIVDAEANSSLFTLHFSLSEWYTLDGRRMKEKPTERGIYIHNGKKEVIK